MTGRTRSKDLPTTPGAFASSGSGRWEAFVCRLHASGGHLVWSTYLGAMYVNWGALVPIVALAVDSSASVYVAGATNVTGFPTTPGSFGPGQHRLGGFVAKLDPTGSMLLYSGVLHGRSASPIVDLALDGESAVVVGFTPGAGLPVTAGAYAKAPIGGHEDGFVARISPDGSRVTSCTYLGTPYSERCYAVGVDPAGNTVVVGVHSDASFGAPSISSGLLARLTPGGGLIDMTLKPSAPYWDLAVAPDGGIFIAAGKKLPGYLNLGFDLRRLGPDGTEISLADAITTDSWVMTHDIAAAPDGSAVVVGYGWDTPTPGAFDAVDRSAEGFVLRAELECAGSFAILPGTGCPGAAGVVPELRGGGCPMGGHLMQIQVAAAGTATLGLLLIGAGQSALPLSPACTLSVGPLATFVPAKVQGSGALLSWKLPSSLPPMEVWLQYAAPKASGQVVASNALRVRTG